VYLGRRSEYVGVLGEESASKVGANGINFNSCDTTCLKNSSSESCRATESLQTRGGVAMH
jgi:hypothetical protein